MPDTSVCIACIEKKCNGELEEYEVGIFGCNECQSEFVKINNKFVNTDDLPIRGM